ncbi:hypothetical protein AMAG_14571 [Allomyces macrogynus ATCC 38327]|uniref:Uncharacterized protein n=1 Tax=Allomyces macrogynus (strain ATCC 38327) TaxID=578462 RepID=A0A0L0T6R7_ALLM3|nr:hypothetical protein AMAG_14571 [Allomyces macrogynus ATCC 38327]|eukprot:KNE70440.1 hypothetical protein AMAG_14571 [Allomyces macrogynus ATCC 38327]
MPRARDRDQRERNPHLATRQIHDASRYRCAPRRFALPRPDARVYNPRTSLDCGGPSILSLSLSLSLSPSLRRAPKHHQDVQQHLDFPRRRQVRHFLPHHRRPSPPPRVGRARRPRHAGALCRPARQRLGRARARPRPARTQLVPRRVARAPGRAANHPPAVAHVAECRHLPSCPEHRASQVADVDEPARESRSHADADAARTHVDACRRVAHRGARERACSRAAGHRGTRRVRGLRHRQVALDRARCPAADGCSGTCHAVADRDRGGGGRRQVCLVHRGCGARCAARGRE